MTEHLVLFCILALVSSLVYHALRRDSVSESVKLGGRRFLSFLVIALTLGVCLFFFTRWL